MNEMGKTEKTNWAVRCRDLACRRGGRLVLDRLNLEIASDESVGLLGSSGCGKSTLLRALAGLEPIEQGEITIAGKVVASGNSSTIPPHRRGIAMLFQDLALWPNLTVAGNVRLGLSGLRMKRADRSDRIDQTLKMCGIEKLSNRYPATLSGGQQQRVALARALAMRPRLLLLDEPMGGLDLLTKTTLLEQLARLRQTLRFAILLVTHDPFEVGQVCDSLAIMDQGRIVERGTIEEIRKHPQTLLSQAWAKAMDGESRDMSGDQ